MITQSRIVWLHEQITSSRNNIFVNVCYKSQLQGKQGLLKEPLCDELSEAPLPYHSVVGFKEWQSSLLPPKEEIQKAMRPALAGVYLGNMQTMIWYGCRTADMICTLKITLKSPALLCSAWCRLEIIYKHEIYCDCFKVGREFQCHLPSLVTICCSRLSLDREVNWILDSTIKVPCLAI